MRSASVSPFKTEEEAPVVKVVATALSMVVGLADDRQITFQSGFEGDEPDDVVNARLDRLMKFADRLKARYDLAKVRVDLEKHRRTLLQLREDLSQVEANYTHQQAVRRVEIDERKRVRPEERKRAETEMNADILKMREARQEMFNTGLEEYRRQGRQGTYKPVGAHKANLDRYDSALQKLLEGRDAKLVRFDEQYDNTLIVAEAGIEKADAERDKALANLNISIGRYTEEIALLETREATCLELVGD